jgi:hypothetical protein
MNAKRKFQPTVEGCEKRLALTANAAGITAQSLTQAVVEINNTSSINVGMQFRWNSSNSWQNFTVTPGHYQELWIPASGSLSPQIQFDQSILPGWQNKLYNLSYFTFTGNGQPPVNNAKLYDFETVPGGVNLFSVNTQAVVGFKNNSSINVAFQFRWNTSQAWSSVITLKPGQSDFWVSSPQNASTPQIQFDQSILAGWQNKLYTLSFNVYQGSNSPPSSAAKYYTFKNISGGVDLFS